MKHCDAFLIEVWVPVGYAIFFHWNRWALHLFIPKQTAAAAAGSIKDITFCVPRGVFSRKNRKWKKVSAESRLRFYKWEWKAAKFAFIHIKIPQVITGLGDTQTCTSDNSSYSYNRPHMGPFKIWYSMCNIKVYGYVGVFLKRVMKCVAFICIGHLFKGDKAVGCVWALIKSAHVPVQHPGHISNACSALLCCWNMKYA